jgi:hypothetical protein
MKCEIQPSWEAYQLVDMQKPDIARGFSAVERFRTEVGDRLPSTAELRVLEPPLEWFVNPLNARDKKNPHNIQHVGELLVVGIPFIRALNARGSVQEDIVVGEIRIHDTRLKGWENVQTHGVEAVEFFSQHPERARMNGTWEGISYVTAHHSLRGTPPNTELYERYRREYQVATAIDASALGRVGIPKPEIQFRLPEAYEYQLVDVMSLVQTVGAVINTGNVYTDALIAGQLVGLTSDSRAPLFAQWQAMS